MLVLFNAASCALASWLFTNLVRRYALANGVLDIPNARSSHRVPTPRGGGVGIIIPVVVVLFALPLTGFPWSLSSAAALVVALVAVVGWVDDHRSLSVRVRLIGHLVAGVIVAVVASGAGVRPFHPAIPAMLAAAWWVFWTVSAINVVNFIDGIDGIIGLQAFVYGLFAVAAVGLQASPAAVLALALAGAALGFLLLNWSPARIFMGDVGSGSLGVIFVVLGVLTMREAGWSIVHAFLPLMPIFADEVLTMSRRIARGESLSEPHRTHVYQRLVQAGWGHGPVAALYGLLAATCGAWALIERSGTPVFWIGAGIALVATFALLGLLRGRAERQCGADPVSQVSVAS
jgi:Fuc2NAc and GlcNAc transferase